MAQPNGSTLSLPLLLFNARERDGHSPAASGTTKGDPYLVSLSCFSRHESMTAKQGALPKKHVRTMATYINAAIETKKQLSQQQDNRIHRRTIQTTATYINSDVETKKPRSKQSITGWIPEHRTVCPMKRLQLALATSRSMENLPTKTNLLTVSCVAPSAMPVHIM